MYNGLVEELGHPMVYNRHFVFVHARCTCTVSLLPSSVTLGNHDASVALSTPYLHCSAVLDCILLKEG